MNTGYVKTKIQREGLFRDFEIVIVPTGETRIRDDGEVEAEFIPLTPKSVDGRLWLQRKDIF